MRELGKMTPEERQAAGPALNALKDEINSALAAKKIWFGGRRIGRTCLRTNGWTLLCQHANVRWVQSTPISQVQEEVTAIFAEMGVCRG